MVKEGFMKLWCIRDSVTFSVTLRARLKIAIIKVKGLGRDGREPSKTQQCSDFQRESKGKVGGEGSKRVSGNGRRLGLEWWAHNIIHR